MEERELQPWNGFAPMFVMQSGILKKTIFSHFLNAPSPMDETSMPSRSPGILIRPPAVPVNPMDFGCPVLQQDILVIAAGKNLRFLCRFLRLRKANRQQEKYQEDRKPFLHIRFFPSELFP